MTETDTLHHLTRDVCTNPACLDAVSHESLCTCRCGGPGHGLHHREARQRAAAALARRTDAHGFTPAMYAAIGDDDPF